MASGKANRLGNILAIVLSASIALGNLSLAVPSAAAAVSSVQGQTAQSSAILADTADHWAKETIERWSARGIVNGAANGKFEPDRPVTRSEWVSLLNRVFQLQSDQSAAFTDVPSDKWYAADVSTAVYGGYVQGFTDGTFRPSAQLTRAEAAVSITKLLKLPNAAAEPVLEDRQSIKEWSKNAVNSVVEQGILTGYSDHTFKPQQALTRAEALTLADRAVNYYGDWYGEAGIYGPSAGTDKVSGSVIINAPGITLKNTEISGDLIIGKGAGSGDVYLNNIKVKGQLYIYGGGENSVHLQDSVVIKVIVDKKEGTVRLVAEGSSTIQEVTVNTGATLDVSEGATVDRVSLTENLPPDSTVSLKGYFNTVNVEAYSISVKIPEGSIKELNVTEQAGNTTIDTSQEATILNLVLNAAAKIIGLGTIENSVVNAQGVSFENSPEKLTAGSNAPADLKVSIGGAPAAAITPQTTVTPAPVVAGGTSGGSTPVETSAPTAAPVPTATPVPTASPESTPTPPINEILTVEKQYVGVGEAVYFTTAIDLDVYLVSNRVYYVKDSLDLAVDAGEGILVHARAGVRNFFDTSVLRDVGFPENYEFNIFGYEGDRYTAYKSVTILNEQEPLRTSPPVYTHLADPEYLSFNYNRLVQLIPGQSTANIVLIREQGQEYVPFNASLGLVEIEGNVVYVKPLAGTMQPGKTYDFKLLGNVLTTSDGEQNAEYETLNHKTTNKLRLISPVLPEGQYEVRIKVGDILTYSVTDAGTVYLIPSGTTGTQEDFDRMVEEHWGLKAEVTQDMVNQPLQFDTSSLTPGDYSLQAWFGTQVRIIIEE